MGKSAQARRALLNFKLVKGIAIHIHVQYTRADRNGSSLAKSLDI